jgi:predicted RNA-binding Zn ribbon-like protein
MTATRPPPLFIADNMGLDFLNSIAVPVDIKVEWLTSGEDLLAWLQQAGLVPEDVLDGFRKKSLPGELDAIAAQARALRDWFKPFVYKHMGKPIGPRALRELEPLNDLLARDEEFGQIVVPEQVQGQDLRPGRAKDGQAKDGQAKDGRAKEETSGLVWRPRRHWKSPESLLLPLARSLAGLVCSEDFTNVKACEGPACTLLFVDRTRGRVRRWCSMAVCGNRAKQAAHRKRAQQAPNG